MDLEAIGSLDGEREERCLLVHFLLTHGPSGAVAAFSFGSFGFAASQFLACNSLLPLLLT